MKNSNSKFKCFSFGILCALCSSGFCVSNALADNRFQLIVFDQPKFVSLKNNFVPLRTGPGENYPIEWEYHAKSLPVQALAKYNGWVKIKDFDGTTGWVKSWSISGKRTFRAIATVSLKRTPDKAAPIVATVEANALGDIVACPQNFPSFCRVEIQGYQGWLERSEFFGVMSGEFIE